MFEWKEDYLVGIKEIDKQHKMIFDIANRASEILHKAKETDEYKVSERIVNELKEYTIYHFYTEEEYMLSINYKGIFWHKMEHENFIKRINSIKIKDLQNNQERYVTEILELIISWITKHILIKDKDITRQE